MSSKQPKAQKAPFEQQQQQTNTYGNYSIADTPEARAYLSAPLDFGDETDVDPGVGRRTDLAEQEVGNRYDSAFMSGIPAWIRNINRQKETRDVQARGAYEAQNARYLNQQGNNQRRGMVTQARLGQLERVLPQIVQTGGSGSASGYNTQFPQAQPGFWQRLALGVAQGAAQGATGGFAGG